MLNALAAVVDRSSLRMRACMAVCALTFAWATTGHAAPEPPATTPSSPAGKNADEPIAEAEASALLAAGKAAEAQSALQVAVLARPDAPALRYRLAVAAALAGDRGVATAAALAAVRLDPGNAPAVSLAAALHLGASDAPAAPTGPLDAAGQALADGRLRAAAALAAEDAGASADPGRVGAQARVRGLALLGLGRAEEALPALRAAAAAGPTDAAIWLALGVAYSGVGRAEAARICFDVARAAAPPRGAVAAAARDALGSGPSRPARARP